MLIEITYNVTDVYMSTTETPVYVEISFEQPGGTSAVWGSITGTLSNQTDLQNALNAKFDDPTGTTAQYLRGDGSLATFPSLTGYVPYTGATTNVDLGEYELKAGQLTLDTSPTGTAAVGTTRWNDTIGSSQTTLKGGSVILKNGVDLVARVVNKVTPNTTLTKAAYQAVRVSGAQGQRLAVELAQANNDNNSADTIGLVTETIAANQEGFIMTVGSLEGINTTGSLQGETWADGDVLYLSPTIAGAITNVQPTGSGHIVVIGYVEYAHANNGKIYIKILNGWELTELHDTEIVSPANNEALIYESSTSLWKNKTIATALGYTPANTATTLTINGVTYDLSTSRTWTISGGISGTIATGQVAYATAANTIGGSNNLFWDAANSALAIGGTTIDTNIALQINSAKGIRISGTGGGTGYSIVRGTETSFLANSGSSTVIGSTNRLAFEAGGSEAFRVASNRNISIGTTSDLGVRLGVVGDTLLRGSGATSATTALTVQNSSSTNLFTVRNDGLISGQTMTLTNNGTTTPILNINNATSATNTACIIRFISSNVSEIGKTSNAYGSYKIITNSNFFLYNATAGDFAILNDATTGTIKMAAGASSTSQFTIKANGTINMSSLPTSATGLVAGDLWNNAGVINIV